MNVHPLIPQAVGIAAVIAYLLCYQQKTRRGIILLNVTSRLLYILQYLLLGAISGAILDVLGSIASVIAERRDTPFLKKNLRAVFLTVNAVIVAVGLTVAILNQSLLDLLPIAGVLFHTGAFWLHDEQQIRRVSLCGSPFWLWYNLASRAYGSAVGDALTIASILIAMVKYRKKNKENT